MLDQLGIAARNYSGSSANKAACRIDGNANLLVLPKWQWLGWLKYTVLMNCLDFQWLHDEARKFGEWVALLFITHWFGQGAQSSPGRFLPRTPQLIGTSRPLIRCSRPDDSDQGLRPAKLARTMADAVSSTLPRSFS